MTEELVRGLTLKSVLTGIVVITIISLGIQLTCPGTPLITSHGSWHTFSKGWVNQIYAFGFSTLTMLAVHGLNRIKRIFSRQEMTILLIMVLTSTLMFGQCGPHYAPVNWFLFGVGVGTSERTLDVEKIFNNVPPILAAGADPDYWKSVNAQVWAPTNWSYILPGATWISLFFISLSFMCIFLALLLRKIYMDAEALSFPIGSTLVELSFLHGEREEKKPIYKNKLFIAGFLFQFLWLALVNYPIDIMPLIDPTLRPASARAMAEALGHVGGIFVFPEQDYVQYNLFGTYAVPFYIFLHPWAIGWGVTLSMDVLIGFFLSWLIAWLILPIILTPMGGFAPLLTSGRNVRHVVQSSVSTQYTALYHYVALGQFIGLALIPLIRNRKAVAPILKGIFTEPPTETDPDRPIPYRYLWIGLAISVIVVLATAYIASIPLLPMILLGLLILLIFIGGWRLVAETGGLFGNFLYRPRCDYSIPALTITAVMIPIVYIVFPYLYNALNTENVMFAQFFGFDRAFLGIAIVMMFVGVCALESQKISRITKTRAKDALMAVLIAVITTVIVWCFGSYILIHILPNCRVTVDYTGGVSYAARDIESTISNLERVHVRDTDVREGITFLTNSPLEVLWRATLGFVIMLAIFLIRDRYAWFRISAAGVLFGFVLGYRLWSAFTVAMVLKYLAVKFGGIEVYQEKLYPLALGMFYAVTIYTVPHMILFWSSGPIGKPAGI